MGLEFPVFLIVGMEEKLLPHIRSFDDPDQMEEERRLCYVGITRAKRRVYLVHAFRRTFMGNSNTNPPSRFLEDIPRHLTTSPDWSSEEKKPKMDSMYAWERVKVGEAPVKQTPKNTVEIKDGDRVRHAQFGEGVVVSCKKSTGDAEVTVVFTSAGIKHLMQSYARLEKIN
jgi:DNA helicase-2/ATP-dependent DNA helicase PcrA